MDESKITVININVTNFKFILKVWINKKITPITIYYRSDKKMIFCSKHEIILMFQYEHLLVSFFLQH